MATANGTQNYELPASGWRYSSHNFINFLTNARLQFIK